MKKKVVAFIITASMLLCSIPTDVYAFVNVNETEAVTVENDVTFETDEGIIEDLENDVLENQQDVMEGEIASDEIIDNLSSDLGSDLLPVEVTPISKRSDYKEFKAIHNRKELEAINNNLNGKYYLANDIDLSGAEWIPIGYKSVKSGLVLMDFRGVLDGQGHAIKNMTITATEPYVKNNSSPMGLIAEIGDISTVSGSKTPDVYTVQNLIMENVNIQSIGDFDATAAVAGQIKRLDEKSSVLFNNIAVTGSIHGSKYTASVIGIANNEICDISNCVNYANVISDDGYGAGIISCGDGIIENCVNNGLIEGHGGIVTSYKGNITNCVNNGEVKGEYASNGFQPVFEMQTSIGGIVGSIYNYSFNTGTILEISNCKNYGRVAVYDSNQSCRVGGIAGYSYGTRFTSCSNCGNVNYQYTGEYKITSEDICSGGIAGYAEGYNSDILAFVKCTNFGTVTGEKIAGIVGITTGNISECSNAATIMDGAGIVFSPGGVYGYGEINIIDCTNYGNIQGAFGAGISYSGGAVIKGCKNYGTIDVTYSDSSPDNISVAGIAIGGVSVSNCINYADISVRGTADRNRYSDVCGISGTDCTDCINYGDIYSDIDASGIGGSSNIRCRNEGDIVLYSDLSHEGKHYCGGISSSAGIIEECSNIGNITVFVHDYHERDTGISYGWSIGGAPKVGGIAGYARMIRNCYSSGDVSVQNLATGSENYYDSIHDEDRPDRYMFGALVGGISGEAYSVENCYSVGTVYGKTSSGHLFVGGVTGYGGTYREDNNYHEIPVQGTISLCHSIEGKLTEPLSEIQELEKGVNAIGNRLSLSEAKNNLWRRDGIDQESSSGYSSESVVWFGGSVEPMNFYKQKPYDDLKWDFDNVWMWPSQGGLPVLKWENLNYGPMMGEVTEGGHSSYVARGETAGITWSVYRKVDLSGNYYSLKLEGKGDMPDYTPGTQPWSAYNDRIISVQIDKRITSIGAYAFAGLTKGDIDMILGTGLTKIGTGAFAGSAGVKALLLPKSLKSIAEDENDNDTAFTGCDNLTLQVWHDTYALEYAKKHNLKYIERGESTIEVEYYSKERILNSPNFDENVVIQWDWSDFTTDPTKIIGKNNLIWAALWLSDAAERSGDTGNTTRRCMDLLGFDDHYIERHYDASYRYDYDKPAYSIASKKTVINGKTKIIVAFVARGTRDFKDFKYKDFQGGVFNGFLNAGTNAYNTLNSFIESNYSQYKKSDIILYITGHSLGGAVAGQVARKASNDGYLLNNTFVYTFASPNYDTEDDRLSWYKNVMNIIHDMDAIPNSPSGYRRVGYDVAFGGLEYNYIQSSDLVTLPTHVINAYYKCLKKWSIQKIKMAGKETSIQCPVDIKVYDRFGELVAATNGENVDYRGIGNIMVYTHGEEKEIYSAYGENYYIDFVGTDDGSMDYYVRKYDSASGTILEENSFKGVQISKDKTFSSEVFSDKDIKLYVTDEEKKPINEVLNNGHEVKYYPYGDVLESDIPADGVIPDGIWLGGVKDLVYTGKKLTQDFRVYDGTTLLTVNKDFKVTYKNNQKQYTIADPTKLTTQDIKSAPQIMLTMKGNYSGKETVYFSINATGDNYDTPGTEKYSIAGDKISIIDTSGNSALSAAYDKSGAKPTLRIIYEDTILKEGRDYSLKYSGNMKYPATKASVTITGMGDFNGKKTVPITITQRPFSAAAGITVVATDKAEGKKAGQYATTVKVFDSEGKLLKAGTDYEKAVIYLKDGAELTKTDFPKAGDAITVRITGKGGYTNSSIEATYNIVPAGQVNDIGKATFKIKPQQYNKGTAVTISEQEMFDQAFIGKGKTPLKLSTDGGATGDFMVVPGSYTKNTTKGTAKVTFMGINGKTGTKTVSYSIGTRSVKDIWYGWIRQKKYYQTNEEILALIKQYCVNNMTSSSTDKVKEVDDYLSYRFIRSSDLGNGLYAYCADALVYRTYYAGMLIMPDGTIYNKETQPEMFEKYKDYFPSSITDFSTFWNKVKNDPTYVHGGFGDDEIDDEHKEIISKWTGTYRLDSQNAIEVLGVYEDRTIGFRLTVADASGESTVTNSYTAKFTNDAWTEFSIPYQSGINEIFRLEDTGIRVSLDIDMQGANDGLYVKM